MDQQRGSEDTRPVFFFDIDNCLYSRDSKIHDLMQELIDQFFAKHLSLSIDDAVMLHNKYYKEYGLAIEGLTRNHKIDPLEFNSGVDDALPLDSILKFDPALRRFLEDFDTSKVKLWLFTNAYINHGRRVVKLLGVDDLFEGITYCDYAQQPLICKPHAKMFEKAEREAHAPGIDQCFFVDDSQLNCRHAQARGWITVHFVEPGLPVPPIPASKFMIRNLEELRELFPQFFKPKIGENIKAL
ncbi:pyrimidine 5'-nucleotidase [Coccidioides immitis RS]|uniref:Pyrimidine 5'-nucleotidase n=3 Tax=Coccidioides immitis TaxID=5501 RepID=A0A0D8JVA9_COCIM|nr:pyrimidine 5'-nucleotidase [Coccidioides immitis RS]KJF61089.1 pyrimidine 5'-nucleotidase [Coccidioides immitis RS]KMU85677.1 SSM1 [Coccidioides immitis H538.4]